MEGFKVKGQLENEVEGILMDLGVANWEDGLPLQLADFVQREAIQVITQARDNYLISQS
eukprot:CAMPEP_0113858912 /NCGR_PEP_ID=MMETSP0372-20130328/11718_1 /TAXON_ID=340204 /ORGANISM="Lankesteria abbotti" /LENGTH=58 /DNA_ID=CAMNT_0000836403 /DNA_START=93 /DNA_END=265 /DNA_ORIENTATION=+ /assembly_acc=CAM_ASM_000359